MEIEVVARFAPSPTGELHIGGARTALFAWAFARRHSGRFILRLEDTDRSRSTAQSARRILNDLSWLGLDWDEGPSSNPADDPYDPTTHRGEHGPYCQSQRLAIYRAYMDRLLKQGLAYKDFTPAEALDRRREQAKAEGKQYRYDPTEAMNLSPERIAQYEAEGRPYVVRFHQTEGVGFTDEVFGAVQYEREELEDFVIQKADGYPTFHFAVVVDDAAMGVTHVIRGVEHLSNTPKHIALQKALGLPHPTYAHTPTIMSGQSKMSKREKAKVAREGAQNWLKAHGGDTEALLHQAQTCAADPIDAGSLQAFLDKRTDETAIAATLAEALGLDLPEIDVEDFRASGYLPEVILNYISLLGWSPGGDRERFDLDFIVEHFDLNRIGKSNAQFDRDKLLAFNAETLQKMPADEFRQRFEAYCHRYAPEYLEKLDHEGFALLAASYQERTRVFKETVEAARFFVAPDESIEYEPKAVKKVLSKNDGEGLSVLRDLLGVLGGVDSWEAQPLESAVKAYAEQKGLGLGKVAQPIRVAVSGGSVSPPIYDTLVILGRDSTLSRIQRCLSKFEAAV